jgi:hypothetical protein
MTKPRCRLVDENGNIFHLMGLAARALRGAGMGDKVEEMRRRVINSDSYDGALCVLLDYVEEGENENANEC